MKKILVPVDYNNASKSALKYASKMAKKLNLSVVALHVLDPKTEVTNEIIKEFEVFVRLIIGKKKPIDCLVKNGSIVNTIVDLSNKINADLIVIGVRKKHSLFEQLTGSVSQILTRKSNKPTMIIPEDIKYQAAKSVAFANDLTFTNSKVRHHLKKIAQGLNIAIEQFFIIPSTSDDSAVEVKHQAKWLKKEGEDFATYTTVRNNSVSEGIDFYILNHEPDLLALYVSHRKGFRNLFHTSLAEKIIPQISIPLIVFNENLI